MESHYSVLAVMASDSSDSRITSNGTVEEATALVGEYGIRSIVHFIKKGVHKKRHMRLPFPLQSQITFNVIYHQLKFQRALCMKRETFENLLCQCGALLIKDVAIEKQSGRTTISAKMRLGITLRMLVGDNCSNEISSYRVGTSTIYDIFHETNTVLL